MFPKVVVLGAGAWGTALAKTLADSQGEPVVLWSRSRDQCNAVNTAKENARYLPGVSLPSNLTCEADLARSVMHARMLVFAVPSQAMREVARSVAPHVHPEACIVNATKGIEGDTLTFMDEVLASELPDPVRGRIASLSGPSFAKELACRLPTAVVVAAHDGSVRTRVMRRFRTEFFRTYGSEDVAGVECGGALKNVIAIAAGGVDGIGLGHNARAALITRGLAEIVRLALARGGSSLTLAGLAGVGDLVLTCTSELSRNRTVGYELGRGRDLRSVLESLGHVAEGVGTAKSAFELSAKLGVEMPITREVYQVLYEGKPVSRAMRDLTSRAPGHEFDPSAVARATLRP
jgi:glycerol-3-phosphate dehydrogenase (NAD(P)+)